MLTSSIARVFLFFLPLSILSIRVLPPFFLYPLPSFPTLPSTLILPYHVLHSFPTNLPYVLTSLNNVIIILLILTLVLQRFSRAFSILVSGATIREVR